MNPDPSRLLRLRWDDHREPGGLSIRTADLAAGLSRGTPRFLGQVFDGGAIPSSNDRVYLVHPVRLSGTEAEGSNISLDVDSARTVPVVVIGSTPLKAGDYVVALSLGGRWVAQSGGVVSRPLACSPCAIPRKDLNLSWTNSLRGNGSTPLVFASPDQWKTACANEMVYSLRCTGSTIELKAAYFVSGGCPGGQSQNCASTSGSPQSLVLSAYSCRPFFLRYTLSTQTCPVLSSNGYASFTVTE